MGLFCQDVENVNDLPHCVDRRRVMQELLDGYKWHPLVKSVVNGETTFAQVVTPFVYENLGVAVFSTSCSSPEFVRMGEELEDHLAGLFSLQYESDRYSIDLRATVWPYKWLYILLPVFPVLLWLIFKNVKLVAPRRRFAYRLLKRAENVDRIIKEHAAALRQPA